MKKSITYLFISIFMVSGVVLFMTSGKEKSSIERYHAKSVLNTSGPSGGLTGAPGESNCTNCHAGAVQDGSGGINAIKLANEATEYVPGQTIDVKLVFNEGASKNGFQLVALNESNEMAGDFLISDASSTQLKNGAGGTAGRIYVTHTATGSALSEWDFEWKAPSSGDDVTFYVATNKTNANNGSGGDVVYLSSHTFSSDETEDTASLNENEIETIQSSLLIGYLPVKHALLIEATLPTTEDVSVNVVSLSGQSVHFQNLGQQMAGDFKSTITLPKQLESGIFVATIFVGNKPYSKKFMVSK